MKKWNAVMLFSAVCVLSATSNVRAQQIPVTIDGCAELAQTVYEEVSNAAFYGAHRGGPWIISPRFEHLSVCESTTKTVSKAFTLALASAGISVRWSNARIGPDPGDYCLSGFLSQCYPTRYPLHGESGDPDALFVRSSWTVVSQTVMRAMANLIPFNPFSGNEVRFRPNDLKMRIGLALRSVESIY